LGAEDDRDGRVHPVVDEGLPLQGFEKQGRPLRQQTLNVAEQCMEIERLSE
jgi:hypothetical protein